jgi:putative membrane protein
MHAGRRYSLLEVSRWTRRETLGFLLISSVPTLLYALAGWKWLALPWLPIALIGTAVAFVTGFKNNASYGRVWEARTIWGGIVNTSRAWAVLVTDCVPSPSVRARLFYRHFAWLTALRYQLREVRTWEHMHRRDTTEYRQYYRIPEWEGKLDLDLAPLLDEEELRYVLSRKNRATHLIHLQALDLRQQAEPGVAGEMRHLELQRLLAALLDAQGRCERIKNFPYPRQFATLNLMFVWLFIGLVPLGLLQELQRLGDPYVWVTIPAGVVVSWVIHTMDKIGDSSENPFEGGPNDVPITQISRAIEIDLREMLGEEDIPAAIQPHNNILM